MIITIFVTMALKIWGALCNPLISNQNNEVYKLLKQVDSLHGKL
jgi:hypothetical protein